MVCGGSFEYYPLLCNEIDAGRELFLKHFESCLFGFNEKETHNKFSIDLRQGNYLIKGWENQQTTDLHLFLDFFFKKNIIFALFAMSYLRALARVHVRFSCQERDKNVRF